MNKKILITAIFVILLLAASFAAFRLTDKRYTLDIRPMAVTVSDPDSYVMFADIGKITFYDYSRYYDTPSLVQDNYGAYDIVLYYSVDCGYSGAGTKLNCKVVEQNQDKLVLQYYGTGVTADGSSTSVDDRWTVNMGNLWNGKYAEALITEQENI